jgi:DNA-binding transcriptional ArsR family regulator
VIRVRLTDHDLVSLRLSYAPYWDLLCAAIQAARTPDQATVSGLKGQLLEAARPIADLPSLHFLRDGAMPCFLTVVPEPNEDLATSLDRLEATAAAEIERGIDGYAGLFPDNRDRIRKAWSDPRRQLRLIRAAFERAWEQAFESAWPAIEAVHLGDLAQRSAVLANDGPLRMLDSLQAGVRLEGYELCLPSRTDWTYAPAGAGIVLLTSVFAPDRMLGGELLDGRWLLAYPPAGRSLVWLDEGPAVSAQMIELIGPVRAQILAALEVPLTTGDIARICGLAPNTASYHLARLRDAGMVLSTRLGRRSFYRLARRGSAFQSLWVAPSRVKRSRDRGQSAA